MTPNQRMVLVVAVVLLVLEAAAVPILHSNPTFAANQKASTAYFVAEAHADHHNLAAQVLYSFNPSIVINELCSKNPYLCSYLNVAGTTTTPPSTTGNQTEGMTAADWLTPN